MCEGLHYHGRGRGRGRTRPCVNKIQQKQFSYAWNKLPLRTEYLQLSSFNRIVITRHLLDSQVHLYMVWQPTVYIISFMLFKEGNTWQHSWLSDEYINIPFYNCMTFFSATIKDSKLTFNKSKGAKWSLYKMLIIKGIFANKLFNKVLIQEIFLHFRFIYELPRGGVWGGGKC